MLSYKRKAVFLAFKGFRVVFGTSFDACKKQFSFVFKL